MKDIEFNESLYSYKGIPDSLYTFNSENIADFGYKTDESFRRVKDSNIIFDKIEGTNWNKESNYHNSYSMNIGRTIKMKNKEWHALRKNHALNVAPKQ